MSHALEAVKAVIFDLDDTLYDCSGTLVHSNRLKTAKIVADAIGRSEKEAYELLLILDKKKTSNSDIYEEIARQFSLPVSFLKDIFLVIVHQEKRCNLFALPRQRNPNDGFRPNFKRRA